jgi:hypothetical protein
MKKLAILMLLALEVAVCGCGTGPAPNIVNTTTSGFWEAQLIGGTGAASQLNFVTAFNVENVGPLEVTSFSFINGGACFANGNNTSTQAGTASFTTNTSTGQVTGSMTFTVTSLSPPGNVLTLTSPDGSLTGTSNGTTTTTGSLSNGIAVGSWNLATTSSSADCSGHGTFIMCQGKNTCAIP